MGQGIKLTEAQRDELDGHRLRAVRAARHNPPVAASVTADLHNLSGIRPRP